MSSDSSKAILPSQLTNYFQNQVPAEIQKALLRSILQHYRDASEHCFAAFRGCVAKETSGYYRRGKIEDEWFGIADRFKPLLQAEDINYKHDTGRYTQLTCRGVRMTQSCVLHTGQAPREAAFRGSLAGSGQLPLAFSPDKNESDSNATHLYAIIIHGVDPRAKKRERCAFAWVRFPDKKCNGYLGGWIDLFKIFPEVYNEFYPPETPADEGVKPTPKPQPKPRTNTSAKAAGA